MRVRYGKPIKVKSSVEKQNVLSHANHNINHICFNKNNSFSFSSELPFSSAAKHINIINGHKYFCFVKLNFTPTGTTRFIMYKGDGTVNGALSSGSCDVNNYYHCALINVTYNNPDAHLNFYLNTYQFVNGDILFGGIIDLTELGLDNLTAQEFYNKYNRYFSLIATGEEITIDDKAGQIAYKNLEEDSIRCKVAGGSSDIYYGYNSCYKYYDSFLSHFRTGWSESGFATRTTDTENQIVTLTVADTSQTPQWFAYMNPDSFQPSGTFSNHKVLFMMDILFNKELKNVYFSFRFLISTNIPDEWTTCWTICNNWGMDYNYLTGGTRTNFEVGDTLSIKDVQAIDLTKWFGEGKEPTSLADFRERFTKEYYGYCPTPIKLTRYQIEALPNYGYNQYCDKIQGNSGWSSLWVNRTNNFSTYFDCSLINDVDVANNKITVHKKSGVTLPGGGNQIQPFYLKSYFNSGVSDNSTHIRLVSVKIKNNMTVNFNRFLLVVSQNIYLNKMLKKGEEDLISFMIPSGLTLSQNYFYCICETNPEASDTGSVTFSDLQTIDLTEWYGAGNEPSTIEEFKATFPNKYYPYSKKRLLNKYMINKLVN